MRPFDCSVSLLNFLFIPRNACFRIYSFRSSGASFLVCSTSCSSSICTCCFRNSSASFLVGSISRSSLTRTYYFRSSGVSFLAFSTSCSFPACTCSWSSIHCATCTLSTGEPVRRYRLRLRTHRISASSKHSKLSWQSKPRPPTSWGLWTSKRLRKLAGPCHWARSSS